MLFLFHFLLSLVHMRARACKTSSLQNLKPDVGRFCLMTYLFILTTIILFVTLSLEILLFRCHDFPPLLLCPACLLVLEKARPNCLVLKQFNTTTTTTNMNTQQQQIKTKKINWGRTSKLHWTLPVISGKRISLFISKSKASGELLP